MLMIVIIIIMIIIRLIIIIMIIVMVIKAYPNPCSGQHVLALIGWFERASILCGGTKSKSNSHIVHHSNSGCWTGALFTLIGLLCDTDRYSLMKDHVISIEEVSC